MTRNFGLRHVEPKPVLQLERWTSDHNRSEVHYFRVDGNQHGYQGERQYVFGINPEVVSAATVAKIIALIEGQG